MRTLTLLKVYVVGSSIVVAFSPAVVAATAMLHGTGFDSSGTPLGNGGIDGSWVSVSTQNSPNAYVVATNGPDFYNNPADLAYKWVDNTSAPAFSGSSWISNNAGSNYNGPSPYSFTMTFDLTGWDINTVSIAGQWSVDDAGSLQFNGHTVSSFAWGDAPGRSMHSYTVPPPDLLPGLNTVTIHMTTLDQYYDAARFEGTVTGTVVPEPTSLSLALFAFSTTALISRRRK